MSKKIYAGNLSYDTTEERLRGLFAQHGEVISVKVISDQVTGRSKGFAFVEMSNEDEAKAAITALNGQEIDGRNVKVNEALDKPKDRPRHNSYDRRY